MKSFNKLIVGLIGAAVIGTSTGFGVKALVEGGNSRKDKDVILQTNNNLNVVNVTTFDELKQNLASDEDVKIVVSQSIEFAETLQVNKTVELTDLGLGINFTRAEGFDGSFITVNEGANLNVYSSQTGNIVFDGQSLAESKNAITNYGTLTLGSGVEICNFISSYSGVAVANRSGTLNITGAKIYNNQQTASSDTYSIIFNSSDNSTFNMSSGEIYNNSTAGTGVIFVHNNTIATMSGGKIYNNTASTNAGAYYVKASGRLTISGGEIYENQAQRGGAIYNYGSVSLTGGKLYKNTVPNNGGAIYTATETNAEGIIGNTTIAGADIYENSAKYGAGIYIDTDALVTFNSGNIKENDSTSSGGGVFINATSTFVMNGGTIEGNTAVNNGSAIINKANLTITGGTITKNVANGYGVIRVYASGETPTLNITGGTFSENVSTNKQGGVITIEQINTKAIIKNATFTGNTAYYGGAIYTKRAVEIKGVTFTNNTAQHGGAIYSTEAKLEIKASTFNANTATIENVADKSNEVYGGAIYANKTEITINDSTFQNNKISLAPDSDTITETYDKAYGGAIYIVDGKLISNNTNYTSNTVITTGTADKYNLYNGGAICADANEVSDGYNLIINGGTFTNNSASYRGGDIYGCGEKTALYSKILLNSGEFKDVNAQYCALSVGKNVTVSDGIKVTSSDRNNCAYVNFVEEPANPIKVFMNTNDTNTAETAVSTDKHLIRYTANDPYSNIHRTANKITLSTKTGNDTTTYFTKVVKNENDKDMIIVHQLGTDENKINITASEYVVDLVSSAVKDQTVTFKALSGYAISDVTVKSLDGQNSVEVTNTDGVYSFVMPEYEVNVNYTVTKIDLDITVDQSISDYISVADTAKFNETVNINTNVNPKIKFTRLYFIYGGEEYDLVLDNGQASFNMFEGIIIYGEYINGFDFGFAQDNRITAEFVVGNNIVFEGETAEFKLRQDVSGENSRYSLTEVYYLDAELQKHILTKNALGNYELVMPSYNVTIQYTFSDIYSMIDGNKITVTTEQQLIQAFNTQDALIVVVEDITLNSTIRLSNGNYTLISVNNSSIIRGNSLVGNMFEIPFGSTLNLGLEDIEVGIIIDGNNVADVKGSAIYLEDIGVLNIYDGTEIINNRLTQTNFMYSEFDGEYKRGNSNAGGAAVYNFEGVVNMYGGKISHNYSTKTGAAVYNRGRFNLYGGEISYNEGTGSGAGVYNIRTFMLDGGAIKYNKAIGSAYGGGIYNANNDYAVTFMLSGEISYNTASSGAAIYIGGSANVWIEGGLLQHNSTTSNGGAVLNRGSLYVTGGTFKNNSADKGGAIATSRGNAEISNAQFIGNTAVSYGGAVWAYNGSYDKLSSGAIADDINKINPTIFIKSSTFTQNTAVYGGAIAVNYSVTKNATHVIDGIQVDIYDVTFDENIATTQGGALFVHHGTSSRRATQVTIYEAIMTNNKAEGADETRGGAIYICGKNGNVLPAVVTIKGGRIEGNTADKGNGVAVQYAVLQIDTNANIVDQIQTVANATDVYGYIEFIGQIVNNVNIKPISYGLEKDVLRVSGELDLAALVEKITLASSQYTIDTTDGSLKFVSTNG